MTLWLAAAGVAMLVVWWRPPPAARRLQAGRPTGQPGAGAERSIEARDVAVAAAIGSGLVAVGLPLVIAAAGGVLPLGWAKLRQGRIRSRTRQAREAAVAEATFALAGELRAGRTPSEALRAASATAGPLADVLLAAAASVAVGGSAAAELEAAARRPGAQRLHSVAAV